MCVGTYLLYDGTGVFGNYSLSAQSYMMCPIRILYLVLLCAIPIDDHPQQYNNIIIRYCVLPPYNIIIITIITSLKSHRYGARSAARDVLIRVGLFYFVNGKLLKYLPPTSYVVRVRIP